MTAIKNNKDVDGASALVDTARQVCTSLGAVLTKSLQKMSKNPPTEVAEVDGLTKLAATYQKALQTVLDFEKTLEQIARDRAGESGEDIDHHSARREVLGRLAELAGEA